MLLNSLRISASNVLKRLLFSLKPNEMAKMRLLAIWIDQRYKALKRRKKYCDISNTVQDFETEKFRRKWD